MPETTILRPDAEGIAAAAALLRAGGLVAMPTETVYGLAADATNPDAIAALYAAKGRPAHNPLIVHLPDADAAGRVGAIPAAAAPLIARFCPGPRTLGVELRPGAGLAPAVTAGLGRVALRVPAHPVAQALCRALGRPVAAPSANPSGRISPTRAAHVLAGLGGRIAAVIDAGPCAVGVESTILGAGPEGFSLLREGGIAAEEIEALTGQPLRRPAPGGADAARPEAPGQLASHYAPRAAVRLGVRAPLPGMVWIGFGPDCAGAALNLSAAGDPAEAAARLYDVLHEADARAGPEGLIGVAPVPDRGLGRAVNDRLARAAAPRPAQPR
ncbi:MAG: L-threonylcarbamoyladenylate synthase [Gemmobacter sp.]